MLPLLEVLRAFIQLMEKIGAYNAYNAALDSDEAPFSVVMKELRTGSIKNRARFRSATPDGRLVCRPARRTRSGASRRSTLRACDNLSLTRYGQIDRSCTMRLLLPQNRNDEMPKTGEICTTTGDYNGRCDRVASHSAHAHFTRGDRFTPCSSCAGLDRNPGGAVLNWTLVKATSK